MMAVQLPASVDMVRLCSLGVITILLAGGVSSDTFTRYEGDEFPIFVFNSIPDIKTCILEPPNAETFKFKPGDITYNNEKYQIQPIQTGMLCFVTVTNLDSNDEGKWTMTYDHENATSRNVTVTVNVKGGVSSDTFTRYEGGEFPLFVFTSIPNIETCILEPPNAETFKFKPGDITNKHEKYQIQATQTGMPCFVTVTNLDSNDEGKWTMTFDHENANSRTVTVTVNVKGGVSSDTVTRYEGGEFPLFVFTSIPDIETCILEPPNAETFKFKPGDITNKHEKYQIQATQTDMPCFVTVTNLDSNDEGKWTMTFDHENANSRTVTVTVNVKGGVSSDTFTRYEGDEFPIYVFNSIPDIETCILEPPNAESFKFKPGDITYNNEKYQIQPIQTGMLCFVTVTNLDSNDEGKWTMTYDHENATSRNVTVTVNVKGGVSSDTFTRYEGGEFPLFVFTSIPDIETCILEPPNAETFKFKPGDITNKHEKYQIQATQTDMPCFVTVTNLDSNDEGKWTMTFDHENANSRTVTVTVNVKGGVSSDTFTRYEGGEFPLFVFTSIPDIETCILEPPNAETFKFKPGYITNKHEKYQIQATQTGMPCFVTVTNLDSTDEGKWTLTFDHENANSRTVTVTVNVKESVESEEDEDAGIALLSSIHHSTRIGLYIDISLDKQSGAEECYVRPPGGELTKSDAFTMENVTVQKSSNYVSCRITLGPMTETLLGEWRLCGKTAKDEMRCQPANIVWNNNASPGVNWGLVVQDVFSHPVHFGGSVNPGVRGIGDAETCHVITPNGEDLVITRDVKYPHIQRIAFDRPTLCSINFTDIDASSIGDWTIYGKFRALSIGLNEVHLPMRFILYNEEQPFEQAYNVTTLPEDRHLVILGHALVVSLTSVGQVDNCQYRMPTGQSNDLTSAIAPAGVVLESLASPTACQIIFNPTTKDMLGEWQLIGKFSNGNQFTERRQTFRIIEEDPANPIIEDREVQYLSPLIFNTELEASHTVTIPSSSLIENESCHLLTPDGLQYAFIDGFHVPNVEIIGGSSVECGVQVDVLSLDMVGQWTLIARGSQRSSPNHIERRRKFTIRIEEIASLGNAITIIEGADLYVSLPNATHMYHTCKLYGPNHEEVEEFEVDSFRYSSCGFTVRNVTRAQSGTWSIVYGNQITYIANVEVNILASPELFVEDFTWTEGDFVNITLGPQDAVYCRILDTDHNLIFDGFSPCRILLDRVTMTHKGWWSILVGVPGSVIPFRDGFKVNVKSHDKPVVTTSIVKNGTSILLTCSVPAENEVEACLFRDPHSNLFLASHGVGQGGYSGIAMSYESDSESHDCTLRLLSSSPRHLGRWRCAVDTASGTSFGFLHLSDDIMHDEHKGYYYAPSLTPTVWSVTGPEGMPAIMSCAIDTSISYCYFRAPNGTVFNVGPSISSEGFEYSGMGLDAGECGIRFDSLWHNDTGYWTCHVGLFHQFEEESAGIQVEVYEPLKMYHGWQGSTVTLILAVGGRPKLEYCRFLRSDGLLFKSDSPSSVYYFDEYRMQSGICDLTITDPSAEDLQPWTVFAKAIGSEGEVSMTSTFQCPPQYFGGGPLFIGILLWTLFGIVSVMMILACIGLIPKKNREWTYRRASSIRNSLRKQPPPVNRDNTMIY